MERLHGIHTGVVRVGFKVNERLKKEFDEKCRLNNTTPSDMHRTLMKKYLQQSSW